MSYSENEKYLLRFISRLNDEPIRDNNLVETIVNLGIKPDFKNSNPVCQIIDEMHWENYCEMICKSK